MILLSELRTYWTDMAENKLPEIKRVEFVTDESQVKDFIKDIATSEQPFVVVVLPSANSQGSEQDNYQETNENLFYVLKKEDSFNQKTLDIQEELQPLTEAIKEQIIIDKGDGCNLMRYLNMGSFKTDPEYKKWSQCSGWSVSFSN